MVVDKKKSSGLLGEIILNKLLLQTSFTDVIKQLSKDKRNTLFSYTKRIDAFDPLAFFNSKQAIFHGERFFWESPDDKTSIVGLGIAHSISGKTPSNRFIEIEEIWGNLVRCAAINNRYEILGTGPLLFGGFSFVH